MKKYVRMASLALCAAVVFAGADYAFAQKRQIVKYLAKETKAAKGVKIPAVVNPQLSLQMQQRVAQFSDLLTQQTLRQSAMARTELPQNNLSVPGSTALPAGMTTPTPGLETPSSLVVKTPDFESPGFSAKPQMLEFLTSLEALEKYQPQWKNELRSAGFDEKQILEIEQAFVQTEKELFEVDDTGIWIRPLSREWDYKTKLVWYGGMSRKDFRTDQKVYIFEKFDDVFTHLNYQGFVLIHGRAPGEATQLGKKVANLINKTGVPIKLASEQVYEETLEHLRKTGKLPSLSSPVPAERTLRRKFDRMVKKEDWVDPFIMRLKELQTLFDRSDRLGLTDHD